MPGARKRFFTALAGVAAAAALVAMPLVATGASAADPYVGTPGVSEPATPKGNETPFWEARFAALDVDCYKNVADFGTVTDGGKTVTLSAPPEGAVWLVLVVKGATTNNVTENPVVGTGYASPATNGGTQSSVSHWIVCAGKAPEVGPKEITPTLTFSEPTCFLAGAITKSGDVIWTEEIGEDGRTTWTATPPEGFVFPEGFVPVFPVPSLAKLTQGCETGYEPTPITPTLTYTDPTCSGAGTISQSSDVEWVPAVHEDGSTTWTPKAKAGTVLADGVEPFEVPNLNKLAADSEECAPLEDPPLLPGEIRSQCVGDVPYLNYEVSLPEGFSTDEENPVTITFFDNDGHSYMVPTAQPLTGRILWPGASAGEPKMWPGWALVDGEYVKTTENFDWTRNGVTVRFEVNPSYETQVEYPAATALCANPASADPSDPGSLAVTGSTVQGGVIGLGALALVAGVAMSVIAARRGRAKA